MPLSSQRSSGTEVTLPFKFWEVQVERLVGFSDEEETRRRRKVIKKHRQNAQSMKSFRICQRLLEVQRRGITSVTDNTIRYMDQELVSKKDVRNEYSKLRKPSYVNPQLKSNHFDFQTVVELQEKACRLFSDNHVLGTKKGPTFEWMTYKDLDSEIQKFRNVLGSKKFKFNDKVAIISNNRVEWPVIMYATMSLGGQVVPM